MYYIHLACEKSIVGQSYMDLVMFDILKEAVSIHQPFPRMIASESTLSNTAVLINVVVLCSLVLMPLIRSKY